MNKRLTAKVQQLNPNLGEKSAVFSKCLVIEPEDKTTVQKKGCVYAVFNTGSPKEFDTNLVLNVMKDILQNSYYTSESVSVIQSLEKALVEVRDKVISVLSQAVSEEQHMFEFNALGGVLWGNVLYVVLLGKGKSFLVRDGSVKAISSVSEGNFSAASGVLKDDDVVIFSTEGFNAAYPPDKLLSAALSDGDLTSSQACILMKFTLDTSFSEDEIVDFGMEVKPKVSPISRVKAFLSKLPRLPRVKIRRLRNEDISSIVSKTPGIFPRARPKLKIKPVFIVIAAALALGFSIFLTVYKKSKAGNTQIKGVTQQVMEENSESQKQQDEADKVMRIKPEVFYDLHLVKDTVQPKELIIVENRVAVSDPASGELYASDVSTPKFDLAVQKFLGIRALSSAMGKLGFVDEAGFKVYDLGTDKVVESYDKPNLGLTATYGDFIYSLVGDTITRYSKSGGVLEGSLWGQSADFEGAVSVEVAYSIYILTKDTRLVSYTTGQKNNFSVTGLAAPFNGAIQISTGVDFDNVYVLDVGNKRVVVLDKDGKFVKQIKMDPENVLSEAKAIGVTDNEKNMFILSGTKVYKIGL